MTTPSKTYPMRPPEPRALTILLGNDQFSDLWQDAMPLILPQHTGGFRYILFDSERRLHELLDAGPADLVMLYIGNIAWSPTVPRPPHEPLPGRKPNYFAEKIYKLGQLSARCGVRVIASHGMDFTAEAKDAGIEFLETPFTLSELRSAIHTALGFPPPTS